jgi:hypothetical protein
MYVMREDVSGILRQLHRKVLKNMFSSLNITKCNQLKDELCRICGKHGSEKKYFLFLCRLCHYSVGGA